MIIPPKLKPGDEIRVISPATSMALISDDCQKNAKEVLGSLGLKTSYSKNASECDDFQSSSVESRVEDLHEAFRDSNIKGVFATLGGFNSNQLLKYLDYELIKNNPKILCGYSDITVLSNAIYAKTGLVTYSGPHFSSLGMKKGLEYTIEYFKKCLMSEGTFNVEASREWSNDLFWYLDQEKREFIPNPGMFLINQGEAEGEIVGGNLGTFALLFGTEFMPDLKNKIVFVEDDDGAGKAFAEVFDRGLQSLLQQPGADGIKAIIIGREEKGMNVNKDRWTKIIKSKKELGNTPVVTGADFGHTTPIFTFPIGGTAKLSAKEGDIRLEIINH